jgi:hypothetical protein
MHWSTPRIKIKSKRDLSNDETVTNNLPTVGLGGVVHAPAKNQWKKLHQELLHQGST